MMKWFRLWWTKPKPQRNAEWDTLEQFWKRRFAIIDAHYARMSAAQEPSDPCRGNMAIGTGCGHCIKCLIESAVLATPYSTPHSIYDPLPAGAENVSIADPSGNKP